MTLKDLLFFWEVNHTKVNNYQERVYNVSLYNGLVFDLVEVNNQLMQLIGTNNTRMPFNCWPIN